jgi:hypothetical protein
MDTPEKCRYEMRPVSELHAYAKNPRKNAPAVDKVANSIREFGFKVPVVIDRDGVIIAGHTRVQAAKKLKLREIPCIVADDLSDEQVRAFRLADNKVAEFAEWDMDMLAEELDGLDFDMSQFGFEPFDEPDEREPSEPSEPSIADHFTVIVECKDELDQQRTFEKLQAEGFQCRLSTL